MLSVRGVTSEASSKAMKNSTVPFDACDQIRSLDRGTVLISHLSALILWSD